MKTYIPTFSALYDNNNNNNNIFILERKPGFTDFSVGPVNSRVDKSNGLVFTNIITAPQCVIKYFVNKNNKQKPDVQISFNTVEY